LTSSLVTCSEDVDEPSTQAGGTTSHGTGAGGAGGGGGDGGHGGAACSTTGSFCGSMDQCVAQCCSHTYGVLDTSVTGMSGSFICG
jgi:hypothetical protein